MTRSTLEQVAHSAAASEAFGVSQEYALELSSNVHARADWQRLYDERVAFLRRMEMRDLQAYAIGLGLPVLVVMRKWEHELHDIIARHEINLASGSSDLGALRNRNVL